jgi:hypothetical protein
MLVGSGHEGRLVSLVSTGNPENWIPSLSEAPRYRWMSSRRRHSRERGGGGETRRRPPGIRVRNQFAPPVQAASPWPAICWRTSTS